MGIYTIKKEEFINWYFETGSDDEQEGLKIDLADSVINGFLNNKPFTLQDLFDEIDHEIIPLEYIEEFEVSEDDDRTLGDLDDDFELKLIG